MAEKTENRLMEAVEKRAKREADKVALNTTRTICKLTNSDSILGAATAIKNFCPEGFGRDSVKAVLHAIIDQSRHVAHRKSVDATLGDLDSILNFIHKEAEA